ncbi:host attachment protein [Ectothiorhodospiraceae bacterium 2226]|nr:host attachment protein [Ectothiorhodospiraceae bacterium 2226]
MGDTWVLVADEAKARFFRYQPRKEILDEFETLAHPQRRLQTSELIEDKPGRVFDSAGDGRHSMGQPTDPHEQEALRFAREIAGKLDLARARNEYDSLMVVAAPAFLGILRDTLSGEVRKRVAHEAAKNVVHMGREDILRQLRH